MKLTEKEQIELFKLIVNKMDNRRMPVDTTVLPAIAHKLATEILFGEDKEARPDRGT